MAINTLDLENVHPKAELFDLITRPKLLLCWSFELRFSAKGGGYLDPDEVFKSLLTALKEISESKNKRVRECQFTVWCGEYLDGLWVCVPANLNARVTNILYSHFHQVPGFYLQEFGDGASLPFTLFFRYDRGRVIEYSDDSVAGQERLDAYGAGMTVHYRLEW